MLVPFNSFSLNLTQEKKIVVAYERGKRNLLEKTSLTKFSVFLIIQNLWGWFTPSGVLVRTRVSMTFLEKKNNNNKSLQFLSLLSKLLCFYSIITINNVLNKTKKK